MGHCKGYLLAYCHDLALPSRIAHALFLIEKLKQNLFAFLFCHIGEVRTQELSYILHLGMHDAPVGMNYVCRKHHQGEEETVAVALLTGICPLLLCGLFFGREVIALIEHRIK